MNGDEILTELDFSDDFNLGLWGKIGGELEIGVLYELKKDLTTGNYTGECVVMFPGKQQTRDNIWLGEEISPETFFGMLPVPTTAVTKDDKQNFINQGKLTIKNPTLVVVGWTTEGTGIVIKCLPSSLKNYYKLKKLRVTQPGEPYIKGASKSSIHMDVGGNTTIRLDDTLPDNDPNQLIMKISPDRKVVVTNAAEINFNSGSKGVARKDDAVKVTIPGDSIIGYTSDAKVVKASKTGSAGGGDVEIDGTITVGSGTVKAGD